MSTVRLKKGKCSSLLRNLCCDCVHGPILLKSRRAHEAFWELSWGWKRAAWSGDLSSGDKAPSFKIATDDGETVTSASLKGAPYMSCIFIPRTTRPAAPSRPSAFPRRLAEVQEAGRTGDRRVQGQSGIAQKVSRQTQAEDRVGIRPDIKDGASLGRVGREDLCMAANTWAWSAPPSWLMPRASSIRRGTRLRFPAMLTLCWLR